MSFRSRIWKLTKRIALAVAAFLLIAIIVGGIYQWYATRRDHERYLPPGHLVSVGDHRLHINCTGTGSPTVILEAGLGGGSIDWDLVQPESAKTTRVCSYDRAGVAWSDSGPEPRDAAKITDELHQLLTAANVAPPYVLVGHSLGGIYVQLFATKFPSEVAGVVLVDSSHPDQLSRIPAPPSFLPYVVKALVPIGVARVVFKFIDPPRELSPETNDRRNAMYLGTAHLYSVADEASSIQASLDELKQRPMDLGNKPLIVLSRGLPDDSSPETDALWAELQADHAKRSTNSKHIVATRSGHYIQFSDPQLVVDSIRNVVSGSQQQSLISR